MHEARREARSGAREAGPEPGPGAGAPAARSTYGQILRSSVLIGGAQVLNVAVSVVRSKCVALLLGPSGFGLMGLYTSIANLAQSVAGMGINSSGVRQIAASVGTGDAARVARTAAVLRRSALALGLLGAALLAALAVPVSRLTFESGERALAVAVLSLAVLFKILSDGQAALLQGLRRIPDLARVAVYGGVLGALATIALVWALGERGLAPALVAMAGASLLFSWWYSRRAGVAAVAVSRREAAAEAGALLKLGLAFMASGMLAMGSAYLVRLVLIRRVDLAAAGLYQAAWTVGGLYVGFILQAMGADFYPRLTAAVRDRAECNRLVNEQTYVSLLLAGPGIVATLTLAPLVVPLLYSSAFAAGVDVLRWFCLGATLQVVSWPLGFVIIAEGRQGLFFAVELAYAVAHVAMAWLLVGAWGASGAGVAFFLSYVLHTAMVYPVVRRLTGFRYSRANRTTGVALLAVVGLVFAAFQVLPPAPALALGALALVGATAFSVRALAQLVPLERLPGPLRTLLGRVRLALRGGGRGAA